MPIIAVVVTGMLLALPASLQNTSDPLTNDQIIELIGQGISESIIIQMIEQSGCNCDSSVSSIVALNSAGASDELMLSIINAPTEGRSPAILASGTAVRTATTTDQSDVSFRKTKIVTVEEDGDEGEEDADLVFTSDSILVRDRDAREVFAVIPYSTIGGITYERSNHPRVKTAIFLTPWALFSSGKKHWLTVDFNNAGDSGYVLLRLDKNEYQRVIATAESRTGIDVERIIED